MNMQFFLRIINMHFIKGHFDFRNSLKIIQIIKKYSKYYVCMWICMLYFLIKNYITKENQKQAKKLLKHYRK